MPKKKSTPMFSDLARQKYKDLIEAAKTYGPESEEYKNAKEIYLKAKEMRNIDTEATEEIEKLHKRILDY
jgi:predicted ribosome quality control (RQC) complex YloA/Tae2 family protein